MDRSAGLGKGEDTFGVKSIGITFTLKSVKIGKTFQKLQIEYLQPTQAP
jgi:hypothetical protein